MVDYMKISKKKKLIVCSLMRGLGRLLEGHPGLQGEKQWEVSLTGNCIWVEHNNVFQTTFFVQAHRWKVQVKTRQ